MARAKDAAGRMECNMGEGRSREEDDDGMSWRCSLYTSLVPTPNASSLSAKKQAQDRLGPGLSKREQSEERSRARDRAKRVGMNSEHSDSGASQEGSVRSRRIALSCLDVNCEHEARVVAPVSECREKRCAYIRVVKTKSIAEFLEFWTLSRSIEEVRSCVRPIDTSQVTHGVVICINEQTVRELSSPLVQ